MKILEVRRAPETVLTMSWSPGMDLLVLFTERAELFMYRLNWQCVWKLKIMNLEPHVLCKTPCLMAWHPDSAYIALFLGTYRHIIEATHGHSAFGHEDGYKVVQMKWLCTAYEQNGFDVFKEMYAKEEFYRPPQSSDRESELTRGNRKTTVLLTRSVHHRIYCYCSGFIPLFNVYVKDVGIRESIYDMGCSADLQQIYVLKGRNTKGRAIFSLSTITNNEISKVGSLLSLLEVSYVRAVDAHRDIFKCLRKIQEYWKKLTSVRDYLLTLNNKEDYEKSRLTYVNLLLTGTISPELEIFLGIGGQEKELKRIAATIVSGCNGIIECSNIIHAHALLVLNNLCTLNNFVETKTFQKEITHLVTAIKRDDATICRVVRQLEMVVRKILETSPHFLHLLLNTIHSFYAQELSDVVEEEVDTERALDYLVLNLFSDPFDHVFRTQVVGYKKFFYDKKKDESPRWRFLSEYVDDIKGPDVSASFNRFNTLPFIVNAGDNRFPSIPPEFRPFGSMGDLFSNIVTLTDFPSICNTNWLLSLISHDYVAKTVPKPFEYMSPILKAFKRTPFFPHYKESSSSVVLFSCPVSRLKVKNVSLYGNVPHMMVDSVEKTIITAIQISDWNILLSRVHPTSQKPVVNQVILKFPTTIFSSVFFSMEHLCVVMHDKESSQYDLCQVSLKVLDDLNSTKSTKSQDPSTSSNTDSNASSGSAIPTIILPFGARAEPIQGGERETDVGRHNDFRLRFKGVYKDFALGGTRRLASLLSEDGRSLILFDLDEQVSDDESSSEDEEEESNDEDDEEQMDAE